MRIAYICNLPLADVDLSYLQEAQKINDIIVYLFVNPHHFRQSVINLGEFYPKDGIFNWSIYPELYLYKDFIDLDKIKIINVTGEKRWFFKSFFYFNRLRKSFKTNFDVIHVDSIPYPFMWGMLNNPQLTLITVHDPILHSSSKKKRTRLIRKYIFNKFKNLLILNQKQKEEFVSQYKLFSHRIFVSRLSRYNCIKCIPPKIDIKPFDYILFVGRISSYKGVDILLEAMKKVGKEHPEIKLIVAGGGSFDFDISHYVDDKNIILDNRFIPNEELISLIKNSLFVVCPYKDATQSGVVMSAFAFNKPVLGTNVGGLPEMIKDGEYGKIVHPNDVDQLASGINLLLKNRKILNNYSNNISKDYSNGCNSWFEIAKELDGFYREIKNKTKN